MKISVLSVNTPDWTTISQFVESATGTNPVRMLDENRIPPNTLYAFLLTLEFFFTGRKVTKLNELEKALDHVSISLGFQGEYGDMDIFIDVPGNKGYRIVRGRKTDLTFVYMTATLKEWRNLVIENCRENEFPEKRCIFNLVYEQLQRLNLAELFHRYSTKGLSDNTFALEQD